LPVISTSYLKEPAEIIEKYQLGILIDLEKSLDEQSQKIEKLLENYSVISKNCRDYARKYLSWSVHQSRIYQEIVEN